MRTYSTWGFSLILLMSSCSSHMAVLQQDKHENSIALSEMRIEIADLKHTLNNTQVELQILEEQVKNQEALLKKTKSTPSTAPTEGKLSFFEKRLSSIEQIQEKIQTDLKQLSSHANQTSSCLTQYNVKISHLEQTIKDILDLKSSLKTFTSSTELYTVKPGDSLEKIAKTHKVSVESLKKTNQLSHNKILIGQELKIPQD